MKAEDYFKQLNLDIGKITPIPVTFTISEELKKALNLLPTDELVTFTQVIKDPIYDSLAVESMVATKTFISDITLGINYLRFNTIPISKIKRIGFEIFPVIDLNTEITYTLRLTILYGNDNNQMFHYDASGEKFVELMHIKQQLDKLVCR